MGYVGKVTAGGSTHSVGSTLYGTCDTAASTAAKVVTCSDFTTLITGVTIHVKFTYSNSASSPTLNVNSTGAKSIYRYGTTVPSASASWSWYTGAVVSFTYDGSAWIMNDMIGNDNTYDREYVNGAIKAATAITAGTLCCGTSAGYETVAGGIAFDISYPVLYQGTAIAADSTRVDFYQSIPCNLTATNGGTSPGFTLYSAVYLKGTLNGSTFTVASSDFLTQTVSTSADGYAYYYLGPAYNATNIKLMQEHKIFKYYNGAFQENSHYATNINAQISVPTASWTVSNSIYSQTVTVSGITTGMSVEPTIDVYHTPGISQTTWENQMDAWNTFAESGWAITGTNSITLYCYSQPAYDFNISVQCWIM